MNLSVVTPAAQIITTGDAKTHLRVDGTSEDTYINGLVRAATSVIENYTERQLGIATWLLQVNELRDIDLPKHPVSMISQIQYYDRGNALQTLNTGLYDLIAGEEKSSLVFEDELPDLSDRVDAVQITFVSGYNSIPDVLVSAVLLVLGSLYDKRDDTVKKLPTAAEYLAQPYKRYYP